MVGSTFIELKSFGEVLTHDDREWNNHGLSRHHGETRLPIVNWNHRLCRRRGWPLSWMAWIIIIIMLGHARVVETCNRGVRIHKVGDTYFWELEDWNVIIKGEKWRLFLIILLWNWFKKWGINESQMTYFCIKFNEIQGINESKMTWICIKFFEDFILPIKCNSFFGRNRNC